MPCESVTVTTGMFNVGNIIKDSFKQTFLPQADRVSEIEVNYIDEDQDYKRGPFSVYNNSAGNFENKTSLNLFGITKQSEAYRAAMYRLAQNILIKSWVEFEADIDAIHNTIGDVVYVQHDVPEWKEGGRVISSTSNTVTVDKEVTESSGTDKIVVRVYNPSTEAEEFETHTVQSVSGKTITITDTWTTNPSQDDLFCFGTSTDIARQYRIVGLEKSSDQRAKITGVEYNPDIYDYDSDNPTIPISDYDSPGSNSNATDTVTLDKIRREYPKSTIGVPTMDKPVTTNLTWSGNSVDTASWAKDDGTNPILLTYKGVTYEITADSTTNTYIYWDKNSSNNTFKTTNTLANAIGADKWLMAVNDSGTAYPAWGMPVIHAGIVQASTLDAISANLGSITSGTITLSLGGDTRLRIDTNGIYISNNAGSDWSEVIKNDSGTVRMYADVLKAGEIISEKIADAATTISQYATTDGATTPATSWSTIQTLSSFPSEGGAIKITGQFKGLATGGNGYLYVGIFRDSTEIFRSDDLAFMSGVTRYASFEVLDIPGSGTRTYYLKAYKKTGTTNVVTSYRKLNAEETKK